MKRRVRPLTVLRVVAAVVAVVRVARAARRRPPLVAGPTTDAPADMPADMPTGAPRSTISVVVPARDEVGRIGPLLEALRAAPGVDEVVVVDDESTDGTAELALELGAVVVPGTPLPHGWVGKAWAVQQGVVAATGDWVITLDADTRPSPELPRALVRRAQRDGLHFVTVGGRFECPTEGAAWLHPAMLTTLVYRFGPAGYAGPVRADRHLANGQCMAFERLPFLGAGGMLPVAGQVVEDVALARHLAGREWRVAMLDGHELLSTRMYESLGETWRGWGRSLSLPGVEPTWRQVLDLGVVVLAQALPLPRLVMRRGDVLDLALLAMRVGTLAGTAQAYERPGRAYWASPTADLVAAAALARGLVDRTRHWRGRRYD